MISLLSGDDLRILREVGREDCPIFRALVPGLVITHQAMALVDPRLLPLCVKRSLLDVRMGAAAEKVTRQESDIREQESDEFKALQAMRALVEDEIQAILSSGAGGVALGQLAEPESLKHYM